MSNVNVSISGGNKNTTFYLNAGYRNEGNVMMRGNALINKTGRLNLNHYSDYRRFNMNILAGIGQYKIILPTTSMLIMLYDLPPHYPAHNEDGAPNWSGGRAAWIKAIADDGLTWTDVLGIRGDNAVSDMYAIRSIPRNFLFDPQGVIVEKNLRGEALEEMLAGYLK